MVMSEGDDRIWEAAGRRIKIARRRLGMSQEELCSKLYEAGLVGQASINVRTLRRYENEAALRWKKIRIFAKYFNVSVEFLIDLELPDETIAAGMAAARMKLEGCGFVGPD
jgi:transcriptional regulator with XRE-family HTH domain